MSKRKRLSKMTPADWEALERRCADFYALRLQGSREVLRDSLDRLIDLAIHTGRAKSDDLENAAKLSRFLSAGAQGVTS
jgi:hypothetical protein